MEQVWAAMGVSTAMLLAVMLYLGNTLASRIEGLDVRMTSEFAAMRAELSAMTSRSCRSGR